jgi:hypothetical protein
MSADVFNKVLKPHRNHNTKSSKYWEKQIREWRLIAIIATAILVSLVLVKEIDLRFLSAEAIWTPVGIAMKRRGDCDTYNRDMCNTMGSSTTFGFSQEKTAFDLRRAAQSRKQK